MNIDVHQKKRKHSYCNTNESSNLNDALETGSHVEKNEKKKRITYESIQLSQAFRNFSFEISV
jgi:hypothetical protein